MDSICIGPLGAKIESYGLSGTGELLCILAGPVGSLMLLLVLRVLPTLGLFGLIQGFFNLLPVYPLDGGRAVVCIWNRLRERFGKRP